MTKRKTTPIKETPAAIANRLPIAPLLAPRPVEGNFDNLVPDELSMIKYLQENGWWGFLEKGPVGEDRGIEVRR